MHDVVVVGAGAAGLTAAVMLARAKRDVLVISREKRRNSMVETMNNVPYADGLSPRQVYAKMEADAVRVGVSIRWDEVVSARTHDDHVVVGGRLSGQYTARRLLLATGRVDELPNWLPADVWGKAAFDCPYCHASERDGGRFVCVGPGVETLKMAALSRQFAARMSVLVSSGENSPIAELLRRDGVDVWCDTVESADPVERGQADPVLRLHTAGGRDLVADTILLGDVARPYGKLAEMLDLDLDADGFPETTLYGMTSDPLVYSAGNVEGSPYFMWTGAASSGINAARAISEDLAFGWELSAAPPVGREADHAG